MCIYPVYVRRIHGIIKIRILMIGIDCRLLLFSAIEKEVPKFIVLFEIYDAYIARLNAQNLTKFHDYYPDY